MSDTISTKSFPFLILISLCQRHRVFWVTGPQCLGLYFGISRTPHTGIHYTGNRFVTHSISVGYRAKLWKLYLTATISKRNVFGKKASLRLHKGQVPKIQNASYGEEKAWNTANILLENIWKMDVICKKWGIKPNTFFPSVQLQQYNSVTVWTLTLPSLSGTLRWPSSWF